jgi:hypothetical protein
MTIQRMDNVLIVVDDLEAAKSFFIELEGETQVEGPSVDSLIGLRPGAELRTKGSRAWLVDTAVDNRHQPRA